jgi:hypothetical protein
MNECKECRKKVMSSKIVGGNDENISYNTRVSLKRKQALLRSNLPAIRFTTENIALTKSRGFFLLYSL